MRSFDQDLASVGRVDAPGGIHLDCVVFSSAFHPRTPDMIDLSRSFFSDHARTNRLSSSACKYGTMTARACNFSSLRARRSRFPTPI